MPEYLTLEEAAEQLGVEYKTIYRLVRQGDLPAGKIGRIYRIRKEDLDSYFERQKSFATGPGQRSGLTYLEGLRCAACEAPIVSELSIGGRDPETQRPICQACWSVKKVRKVSDAEMSKPAESAPTASSSSRRIEQKAQSSEPSKSPQQERSERIAESVAQVRREGRAVLVGEEGKVAEDSFLRAFAQRLEQVEEVQDPVHGRAIELRSARVKHEIDLTAMVAKNSELPGNRISRFEIRASLFGKGKGAVNVEGIFVSRTRVLTDAGFDADPLGESELSSALNALAQRAKSQDVFTVALLASATGWTAAAAEQIVNPREKSGFSDKRAVAALLDLHSGRVTLDEQDERLATYLPLLDPQRTAEVLPRCTQIVKNTVASRHSLALKDAVKVCNVGTAWARLVFERLKSDPEHALKEFPDRGLVIYRQGA